MSDGHLSNRKFYVEMGQAKERFVFIHFYYNDNCYRWDIKINRTVLECTCVFYNVRPTYLFYTSQSSNNYHSNKHQSRESNFSLLNG